MPNFGVVGGNKRAWKYSDKPRVFIGENETETDWMTCTAIEHSTGITPSRAILRIGTTDFSGDGPITLNRFQFPWTRGTKVVVKVGQTVRFRGCFMKRRDRGQQDDIVWEAWDDKWLLLQMPLRGCIVADPTTGDPKFCSGYEPRFNPYGRWNCMGATINGSVVPVFTHIAEVGKTYEAPDETFASGTQPFTLTAWTPRRMLQYLRALTRLAPGDLPGLVDTKWRSLANCDRLEWLDSANNLIGKDTEQEFDPLDRKLPDMSLRGMKMLGAIQRALDAAGTHGMTLDYTDEKSYLTFYPKGFSANLDLNFSAVDLRILRGGNADDINTIYDFDLEEDATETCESVLVEGGRVHVESNFEYSATSETLQPAWTVAEELAFLDCIAGDGQFAKFPSVATSTTVDQLANGTVAGIFAFARTPEAVALARQFFPTVGRAWVVNSAECVTAGINGGTVGEFSDEDTYPFLRTVGRKAFMDQLQFYIGQNGNRLMQNYPIRIQVKKNNAWRDCPFGSGIRVDERGWIWVDGHWEEQDGGDFCFYDNQLLGIGDARDIGLCEVRMNLAIPLDHRVDGYATIEQSESEFDPDLFTQLGGPPLQYIDSPQAYHENIQYNSSPLPGNAEVPSDEVAGTISYTATPVTRYVPPGSERSHAVAAAERRLFADRWVKRRSRWSYVGIRPDFKLGQWVGVVKVINGKGDDSDYEVSAPIEEMTDDFLNQSTTIGGLISTAPRKASMEKGGEDADGKQYGAQTEQQAAEYEKILSGETPSVGGFVGKGAQQFTEGVTGIRTIMDWITEGKN